MGNRTHLEWQQFGDICEELEEVRQKQFSQGTWDNNVRKAIDELNEVLLAPKSKRLVEYCDSLICVINAARADGFTPAEIVSGLLYKNNVNFHRKQQLSPEGKYQHIEGQ